jgi:nucleotide-binding universal stress UspA family protein/nitrite reductase/ring-hydroxylating ferredoxin subunit
MVYRKIVVGTDGSESAGRAVELATGLAQAVGARLYIVAGGHHMERVAEEAVERAKAAGARAIPLTRAGAPAEVLIDLAAENDADLIVVGDRDMARGRRILLGSVPDRVAQYSGTDVLIVRTSSGKTPEGYERVLIATDGSHTADRAARKGLGLAEKFMLKASLVHVGHPKTGEIILEDTARYIGGGIDATMHAVQGDPVEKILEIADQEKSDLIVIGNKGMTGARRVLLGSVPLAISQLAKCDVLIVRTTTVYAQELDKGQGAIIVVDGQRVAAYRDEVGLLHAVSAKCTHMGCTVDWNESAKTWDCPCHGSRYTIDGANIEGPAPKPLQKIEL